jgi:hypothetical protein
LRYGRPRTSSACGIGADYLAMRGASFSLQLAQLLHTVLFLAKMLTRGILKGSPALRRCFSSARVSRADFTHAVSAPSLPRLLRGDSSSCTATAQGPPIDAKQVIGAGVVGLAVARQLAAREGTSTILLERHDAPGTETSSRNSEVRTREAAPHCEDPMDYEHLG